MEDAGTEIKDLVFSENEEKESMESAGRVLNNLVSNPEEEEEGVVNNFISSLISPKSSPRLNLRGNIDIDSKEKGDDIGFKNKSGEDLGGGFVNNQSKEKLGVIDSLVSHLPTPLAVPAADEASILIHSIVHD